MREISFKAKRKDNGEWVEGYFVKLLKDMCYIIDKDTFSHHLVDENTVCQYTGMTDKNGCRIWENDIVEFEDVGEEGYEYKEGFDFTNRAKVEFTEGRWSLTDFAEENSAVVYEMFNHEEFKELWQYCEVIGNTFDNPELMNTTETIGYADNGSLMPAT